MASTFPAAIASEPPPLDASSEDEDSEEFRSHGLKLDVPSGEPTPVSTPYKRPQTKSPGKRKSLNDSDSGTGTPSIDNIEDDDTVLEVTSTSLKEDAVESSSPVEKDNFPKEDNTNYSYLNHNNVDDSGTDEEISCQNVLDEVSSDSIVASSTTEEISDSKAVVNEEGSGKEVPTCASTSKSEDSAANVNTGSNNCDIGDSVESIKEVHENVKEDKVTDDVHPTLTSRSSIESGGLESQEKSIDSEESQSSVEVSESSNNEEVKNAPTATIEQKVCKEEDPPSLEETSEDPHSEFDNFCAAPPVPVPIAANEAVESSSKEMFPNECDSVDVKAEVTTTTMPMDDDFDDDDFGAFQSIPSDNLSASQKNVESSEIEATSVDEDDDDDDFGDFSQVPAQQQQQQPTFTSSQNEGSVPSLSAQPSFDDSGDFADFRDCSFQSFQTTSTNSQSCSDITRISSKVESLVKSLFVIEPTTTDGEDDSANEKLKSIDSEISNTNAKDNLWARVQDFEGSQGLMFKWLNCLTEKHLLKSLNIDNSNIMYHEKWGTIEVPKFAASLVQSPLQPQSCTNQIDPLMKVDAHHSLVNNNNNNVTDEGMSCQDHDKPPTISVEAQEILRQLPDLSYMRANTLVFPQSSPSGI